MTPSADELKRLESAKPIYFLPRSDVLETVLIPCIAQADRLDCMMGFFSSASLAEIAPGLATYLRSSAAPLRLVINPFLRSSDQKALIDGIRDVGDVASEAITAGLPDADELARHTLSCLAWLIRKNRLQMKIALLREGIFHPKIWLIAMGTARIALHGSSNMTQAGMRKNHEQLALSRAWMDDVQSVTIDGLQAEFDLFWEGGDEDFWVVDLPRAIEQKLLTDYGSGPEPQEAEGRRLWRKAHSLPDDDAPAETPRGFEIPQFLRYRDGDFAHQGRAVDAWLATGGRGVLAMATGSGKTLTSLIATRLLFETAQPMLVVIAAPYVPLVMQWCDEVGLFGVTPQNLSDGGGPAARDRKIRDASRRLDLRLSQIEIFVCSHDLLCDFAFQSQLKRVNATKMLIADEMHNLGRLSFISSPPELFDYRLGLSATPRRQYDPDGTDALFAYFGDVCFEFTLEDAIGVCLVPYDYFVHLVALSDDEMETWMTLTEKIARLGWKIEKGLKDERLDQLLRERRLVIETAEGKLTALAELLDEIGRQNLHYELIYATDKAPAQLNSVNALLSDRAVLFHQLTAEETGDRDLTRRIIAAYQSGDLQALTAKRVLDEGVNIPEIKRAFVLASTTVERQWVQRRGRLLRKCTAIGKTFGIIHDFVVMPPADAIADPDARRLVKSELERVQEFARLSRNYADPGGPLPALEAMQRIAYAM